MSDMKIPQYRTLYKNSKGYHRNWEDAWKALNGAGGETREVMVLYIEGEYYPLAERIELWTKWKDEEYD